MWLFFIIKNYLGWAMSIGRRMISLAGPQVAVVVAATIVSQLARIFAFLLPLKIILLIGSPSVPSYFPSAFLDMDPQALVIGLGLAAIGFYVTYAVSEKILEHFTQQSAERLLAHSAKLPLFPQQAQIVFNACRRMSESIAAVIFVGLSIGFLSLVFPTIAAVIVGWIVGALVAVALLGAWNAGFRAWLENNAPKAIEAASAIGFFIVTATIIGLYIAGTQFSVLLAIIAVLLARQSLQRMGSVFVAALWMYPRRASINTLFLRGHSWASDVKPSNGVWDIVSAPQESWLPQLLADITGAKIAEARIVCWLETGALDVPTFEVKAEGASLDSYLVKIFDRAQRLMAMQEAALLEAMPAGRLPAPVFLGASRVGEHYCHLFEMPKGRAPTPLEYGRAKLDIVVDCWKRQAPADLVHRFRRTHQMLGQRLARLDAERMRLAAHGQQEQDDITRFREMLPQMCDLVDGLPLVISVPDLRAETVFSLAPDRHVILNWGRWKLEPAGAGWMVISGNLDDLPKWLAKAGAARRDLARVAPEQAQLAALLFELERLLTLQRYRAAIELLPAILRQDRGGMTDGLLQIRDAS